MPSSSNKNDRPQGVMPPNSKYYRRKDPPPSQHRHHGQPMPPQQHRHHGQSMPPQQYRHHGQSMPPQQHRQGPPMSSHSQRPRPVMPAPEVKQKVERGPAKGEVVSNKVNLDNNITQESAEYRALEHKKTSSMVIRKILVSVLLLILSTGLEFLRIEFKFLPSFLDVDFSIFPEFIVLVLYGLFAGISVVVLKNIAHMLIFYLVYGNISYVGELSKFLTDMVFLIIVFAIYYLITKGKPAYEVPRKTRRKGVVISGVISSVLTSVIMLPISNYLIYPMFVKYFAARDIQIGFLQLYAEKLPSITSIWQGLLIFNLPWEFAKLICVTIFATITYVIITVREK